MALPATGWKTVCLFRRIFPDGVAKLTGYDSKEFLNVVENDAMNAIYPPDRERVMKAAKQAPLSGEVLTFLPHPPSRRKPGPDPSQRPADGTAVRYAAVLCGVHRHVRGNLLIPEHRRDESSDGIYVIGRHNYELYYVSDNHDLR